MKNMLNTKHFGKDIVFLEDVDSTNTFLKQKSGEFGHGTVVIAKRQHSGKGRLGKTWVDNSGKSLSFSILIKENISTLDLTLLPLLAGVAVCRGLNKLCSIKFNIKWSNDVLCDKKKISGILSESRLSASGEVACAVIGIGVNLLQTKADFEAHNLIYATSLNIVTNEIYSFNQVAAIILNEFEIIWDIYKINGFSNIINEYKKLCITIGSDIFIINGENIKTAKAIDIADNGSLVCKSLNDDVFTVSSGEVSVRGINGYI